jgi:hypothetical protein
MTQAWIVRFQTLLVLQVFVLLPFGSAWTQSFGVSVNGEAKTCDGTQDYDKSGTLEISGLARSTCKESNQGGVATASSGADLSSGLGGAIAVAVTNSAATGVAESVANDTVTLLPPRGFSGASVDVLMSEHFQVEITHMGGNAHSNLVRICWEAPDLPDDCSIKDKSAHGFSTHELTVQKSASGFTFALQRKVTALGGVEAIKEQEWIGTYEVTDLSFSLPKGWGCKLASGIKCKY